ncbi:GDP-mannose 4,6-dehydratase [Acidisoma sp. S159]|uniref:GDP-mannose 4,6-dehydratase n=1 Tax=Acidisoma sp. S159 TaxID=1747225 RepID=UPI00131DD460|nr:GDP-mannose 4,6-dehydratase [Acidisoma sp. S159]
MNPRRIFLTGARGFVGGHMLTRLGKSFPDAMVHSSAADITDRRAITSEIAAARPDVCIHLAAIAAIAEANRSSERAWHVNLDGTLNLAQAVREHVPDCLLLYASSADAYGGAFKSRVAVDEAVALAPLNTYAATKAAADLALGAMAAGGLRCVRLRAFNHTGAGQSDAFVVPSFARQLALIEAGRLPPVIRVGDLSPKRDFLDVRDVCGAYVDCITNAEVLAPGTILNIASGVPRQVGEVLQALLAAARLTDVAIEQDPAKLRPSDILLACGDSARARELLQWQPRVPWDQTIKDVLQDWRERVASA